jgi:23S rRNA (uridine2479-2'-O)-methyltransferase
VAGSIRITSRNARFQQWQALLANRHKRQRAGEFLVQGVRPITLAVRHGWPLRALIYDGDRPLSRWAAGMLRDCAAAEQVAMAGELLRELGEKPDEPPELVAVAEIPADDYARIEVQPAPPGLAPPGPPWPGPSLPGPALSGQSFLGLAFDRPSSPGNIGTLIRSADAFGAAGLIVTGHAADPYDPKSVRASTGSLFAVPVIREASPHGVLSWVQSVRASGIPVVVAGTDEQGTADIADYDLAQPVLIVVGNETSGLSAGWRDACDVMLRIPIAGSASSLNAANAGTVALYEAARQRRSGRQGVPNTFS